MAEIGERVTRVEADQESLSGEVEEMKHRLWGNGNKGDIPALQGRVHEQADALVKVDARMIEELTKEKETREASDRALHKRFDRFLWIVTGIWLALTFLTGNGIVSLAHFLQLLSTGHP